MQKFAFDNEVSSYLLAHDILCHLIQIGLGKDFYIKMCKYENTMSVKLNKPIVGKII